jgi:RNA dependent RNA polymerase
VCNLSDMIHGCKSPSYFASDLRRLRLVSLEELRLRDGRKSDFFERVTGGIVLHVSEAQHMSGGDYDGDEAWICTNKKLLACLPTTIQARDFSCLVEKTTNKEGTDWLGSTVSDWLRYAWHFRNHHEDLGTLANKLDVYVDKFTFDHPDAEKIGIAAFRQVRFTWVILAELPN